MTETSIAAALETHFPAEVWRLIQNASRVADEKNCRAALVGGVVRDVLLNRSILDADVMVEPPADGFVQEMARLTQAKVVSHQRFFTFTLQLPDGRKLDVVTAREETYSAPARLPDVTPATIEKDPRRRDFTVNAIVCWINQKDFGHLYDPFHGQDDLGKKLIRALHEKSFIDDPTRIFRAARFAGRLEFEVEPQTLSWIQDALRQNLSALLSPVRRRHEFELILKEKDPLPVLELLHKWNALGAIHASWASVDPTKMGLKANTPFIDNLAAWFDAFEEPEIRAILADLGFEKGVKKEVLARLLI